jgi:hypothetical protein
MDSLETNFHDLRNSVLSQMAETNDVVSQFGARLIVQCGFIDAVLTQLDAAQRTEVVRLFRHRVEEAMAYTDDIEMPAKYHSAMLDEANFLLTALGKQPSN